MFLSPDITRENAVRLLRNRGLGNLQVTSFSHDRAVLILQHARPPGKIGREFLRGVIVKHPGLVSRSPETQKRMKIADHVYLIPDRHQTVARIPTIISALHGST